MKIDEFIQAAYKAKKNKAERARTNFDEIGDWLAKNIDPEEFGQLMNDILQVGWLIHYEDEHKDGCANSAIMTSQVMIRNKDTIIKLFNAPEMDVEFV